MYHDLEAHLNMMNGLGSVIESQLALAMDRLAQEKVHHAEAIQKAEYWEKRFWDCQEKMRQNGARLEEAKENLKSCHAELSVYRRREEKAG